MIRVYTYPGYVSLGSAKGTSRKLFHFLEKECGLEFEGHVWHGTLDSLPKKPAMVRASSMMKCDSRDFAKRCAELGHFCFYDDQVIMLNGKYVGGDTLIDEVKRFLENYKDEPDVTREQTIGYLLSTSADRSTAGNTRHMVKKAKILLGLFGIHVLCNDVTPSPVISGEYRTLCDPSWFDKKDDTAGLDEKGIGEIKLQLDEDNKKVSGLLYDHPISQAYFRKLAVALKENTMRLQLVYEDTEAHYVAEEKLPNNVGIFPLICRGRHIQRSGVEFLCVLMEAMLPPLIKHLVALGYPESSEVVDWE